MLVEEEEEEMRRESSPPPPEQKSQERSEWSGGGNPPPAAIYIAPCGHKLTVSCGIKVAAYLKEVGSRRTALVVWSSKENH